VKMNVQGLLILKSTAKLFGDIVVSKLAIEPGATFTGTCKMDEEGMPQKKEQNLFEASASKQ